MMNKIMQSAIQTFFPLWSVIHPDMKVYSTDKLCTLMYHVFFQMVPVAACCINSSENLNLRVHTPPPLHLPPNNATNVF